MNQIHLKETPDGWLVESADGGGLIVSRFEHALSLADRWLFAIDDGSVVIRRADGAVERYGENDGMEH